MINTKSKYYPLYKVLSAIHPATNSITFSFEQIEKIIGNPLPPSAHIYLEWWSNQVKYGNRPQAAAWMSADFRAQVNLANKSVVFSVENKLQP